MCVLVNTSLHRLCVLVGQNLSGNFIEEEGAMSLGDMLKSNTWLTHLNLSGKTRGRGMLV